MAALKQDDAATLLRGCQIFTLLLPLRSLAKSTSKLGTILLETVGITPLVYDNVCKRLAAEYSFALVQWLLAVDTEDIELLPTELSREPIRSDAVYFLPQHGKILHIEFQTDPQSNPPIPLRMLDYWVGLYRKYRCPIEQVVIFLRSTDAEVVFTERMYEKYRIELLCIKITEAMARKLYPTDLSDQQWHILKPLIPTSKVGGRPRTVDMREILNAIFYILASGCAWRLMPHDLPPWSTVYHYFRVWRLDGAWQQMNQTLRQKLRQRNGRQPTPSAAIVDSQSVKTTEVAQEVGYDGGKLVKGHKRHILVDTLGLLLQVVVSAANISEKAGAKLLLEKIKGQFPQLQKIFADGGYDGKDFIATVGIGLSVRLRGR